MRTKEKRNAPHLLRTDAGQKLRRKAARLNLLKTILACAVKFALQMLTLTACIFMVLDVCALIEGNVTIPEFLITEAAAFALGVLCMVVQGCEVNEDYV